MQLIVTRILSSAYKGDFAIAMAMLAHLRAEKPEWQLSILSRNPDKDGAVLEKFGTVMPELFSEANGELRFLSVVTRLSRYLIWAGFAIPCLDDAGQRFVNTVSRGRALVFCGGGSPGGYGLHNLILHAALPVIMARKIGRPVIFTGVGSEPAPGRLQRLVTRWILKRASLVIARDPAERTGRRRKDRTEGEVTGAVGQ
jgi:polysaccharide pyruvyl transferase WcaK-like protein